MTDPASPSNPAVAPETDSGPEDPKRPSFPVAEIREVSSTTSALFRTSPMWWGTLICVLLAFWLTWQSIPSVGPTIVIRFPDGHGLKSGDAMRHRGIDVGTVKNVSLSDDLSQIVATVTLIPGATDLAREGTRFWIVRPQLSLAGVSGLETAVGGKYIAVAPGEPNGRMRKEFDGLGLAPADEHSGDGIDVVLRGDAKHGVNAGAPVTWRGVEVGQVLSANLSPDARFVDIHARVNAEFRRLLRSSSKFWVTSGLGVDVGLSGLKLNADSLTTIVRGGVSFATLAIGDDRTPVQSGHMFELHAKPDPKWLTAAASLPLIDFSLPPTVTIQGFRKSSLLGISRRREFTANGLLVRTDNGELRLLSAADIVADDVAPEERESETTAMSHVIGAVQSNLTVPLLLVNESDDAPVIPAGDNPGKPQSDAKVTEQQKSGDVLADSASRNSDGESGLAWFHTSSSGGFAGLPSIDRSALRTPGAPEECCVCRSVKGEDEATAVIQCLSQSQIHAVGRHWSVTADLGDMTAWHGAPIVAMSDGRVIGVFVVSKRGLRIACLE